jgi:hypothetical protein
MWPKPGFLGLLPRFGAHDPEKNRFSEKITLKTKRSDFTKNYAQACFDTAVENPLSKSGRR